MTQVVNLQDHELDVLASFLGHDVRVHREYYRLSEHTLQVAKVAKLLMAMETGDISSMTGKTLDDIEVRTDEGLVEEDSSASEDAVETSANGSRQAGQRTRSQKLGNAGLVEEDSSASEDDAETRARGSRQAGQRTRGRTLSNTGDDNGCYLESEHLLERDGEDLEDQKLHPSCTGRGRKQSMEPENILVRDGEDGELLEDNTLHPSCSGQRRRKKSTRKREA